MQPYFKPSRLVYHCVINGLAIIVLISLPENQLYAASCESVARLVSLEGSIEYKTANTKNWNPAALDQNFCTGDALRSGRDSRAALRMINDTLLRLDHSTAIIFTSVAQKEQSFLDLLKGALHFISRVPRSLEVNTPYLNAAIEGTEFVIQVKQDSAEVTVYEGKVVASNASGSVDLIANQTGSAVSGQAPVRIVVAHPRDAVAWALYYPPLPVQRDKADELSHQVIDAIVKNDIDRAATLAQQAIAENSQSAAAFIAQSYVDQAHFDIPAALQHSRKAAELAPQDAITQARLAEVLLMIGDTNAAKVAANNAVQLDPSLAHTQTVLGFSSLRDVDLDDAESAFNQAIRLDSAAPLPRLGIGLVKIRRGDLKAGREEIETATLLDPNNALLRSYMGKAYFEERRNKEADIEFELAKQLDPQDPTPWLYDAILKQSQNDPVTALKALDRSIELNQSRAPYRSRLLLDEDLAVRSVNLSSIYDDLGFQHIALMESVRSLTLDPTNHSAHRYLSSTYRRIPRRGIAQVSELLQSQLLQPANLAPVQPHLSVKGLNSLSNQHSSDVTFNEFGSLFERDSNRLSIAALAGNSQTVGEEVVLSGKSRKTSYSVGQYHFESDGFRPRYDVEHDIYNLFLQHAVSKNANFQIELRQRETDQGDLRLRLDPDFDPTLNRSLKHDVQRLGMRVSLAPQSHILGSVFHTDRKEILNEETEAKFDDVRDERAGYGAEIQYLGHGRDTSWIIGGGAYQVDATKIIENTIFPIIFPNPFPPPPTIEVGGDFDRDVRKFDIDANNIYTYYNLTYPESLTWTIGLGYENYEESDIDLDTERLNPKLGVQWEVSHWLRFRSAYLRTLKRQLTMDQTLEPTQVAGFNQFFDDFNGTRVEMWGIGFDARFAGNVHSGFEYVDRRLEEPSNVLGIFRNREEDDFNLYANWAISRSLALNTGFMFELDQTDSFDLKTKVWPLSLKYFRSSGIFASMELNFVRQDKSEVSVPSLAERFGVADLLIGYRFPKRRGVISMEVKNIMNEDFRFEDTDFQSADAFNVVRPFLPERSLIARLNLVF